MKAPAPSPASAPAECLAVRAVAATPLPQGFRVLVMREFLSDDGPSAFAVIEQQVLRAPPRPLRHGLAFALAFRPEVVAWLSFHLGKPAARGPQGAAVRNPLWPALAWDKAPRTWPDGTRTIEWSADIRFPADAPHLAFARQFHGVLDGAG
ncbi:hypothetical protein V5F59_21370 [Xanthobacter autotrophicus DSM 431]|uniref:hypothetical protein n=1 Tax=Xanthobacter nonsaccharivorans TaxID=3119912 RepID=UPI00372B8082